MVRRAYLSLTDFSEGGVRVNANGLKIPDEFVLQFSSEGCFKDGTYKVVWRNDPIVGAKFIQASLADIKPKEHENLNRAERSCSFCGPACLPAARRSSSRKIPASITLMNWRTVRR